MICKKGKFKLGVLRYLWLNFLISSIITITLLIIDRKTSLGYNFTQTEIFMFFLVMFILLNQLANFLLRDEKK